MFKAYRRLWLPLCSGVDDNNNFPRIIIFISIKVLQTVFSNVLYILFSFFSKTCKNKSLSVFILPVFMGQWPEIIDRIKKWTSTVQGKWKPKNKVTGRSGLKPLKFYSTQNLDNNWAPSLLISRGLEDKIR